MTDVSSNRTTAETLSFSIMNWQIVIKKHLCDLIKYVKFQESCMIIEKIKL